MKNLPKYIKQEDGIVSPLIVLIATLGTLAFLILSNTFNFKDLLFNSLYPKPPSHAAGVVTPAKLIALYNSPAYPNGTLLTPTEVNQKFQAILATSDSDSWKGFSNGPFLYYVLFDETEGPSGLDSPSAQTKTCGALGKSSYVSAAENSVTTYTHGEFCQIHDSIINKTAFDHDLNPATPDVVATEDWFLHDGNGNRLTLTQGSTVFYVVNPNNQNWREYFIARLFRDLNFNPGQAINEQGWLSRIKATGIYLDNVGLGWASLKNHDVTKSDPKEFSSSTAYGDAVFSFIQEIHTSLHDPAKGYNYPLWANLIAGSDNGSDWDRYVPDLEGGMKEDFVLNWHNGPYSSSIILNQLTQAEKWVNSGRNYVAVGEARFGTQSSIDQDARFSLAAFLLVTDGNNGFYKVKASDYRIFYDYPEYYYQLGAPWGAKYQKSSSPLIYRRNFECGYIELNITNTLGTISYTPGCIPGVSTSPPPTSTPTPSPSPSLPPITDLTAPTVTITSPADGSTLPSKGTVKVNVNATDSSGINSIQILVDGKNVITCSLVATCSYSWNMNKVSSGSHTITAKATDNSSSRNVSSTSIIVNK